MEMKGNKQRKEKKDIHNWCQHKLNFIKKWRKEEEEEEGEGEGDFGGNKGERIKGKVRLLIFTATTNFDDKKVSSVITFWRAE